MMKKIQIKDQFSGWKAQNISGGFVWLYDNIQQAGQNTSSYATAIKRGLHIIDSQEPDLDDILY